MDPLLLETSTLITSDIQLIVESQFWLVLDLIRSDRELTGRFKLLIARNDGGLSYSRVVTNPQRVEFLIQVESTIDPSIFINSGGYQH